MIIVNVINKSPSMPNEIHPSVVHFRRYSREIVLQYLFQCDITSFEKTDIESFKSMFRDTDIFEIPDKKIAKLVYKTCLKLLSGIFENFDTIDKCLAEHSMKSKWSLARMNIVDKNVMRIAIYEMFYCDDIPPIVSINEAVEIGEKYGGEHSPIFINGILNEIKNQLTRPLRSKTTP